MNLKNKLPVQRKINTAQLKKTNSSSYFRINYQLNNKKYWLGDKSINLNNSQKFQLNNSTLINPNIIGSGYSSQINHTNISHNLLYDDIINLKNKLNKLKFELSLLKGENHKKEEEIKKVQKILENSKKKIKDKQYIRKLSGQNQMIKLKEEYHKLQTEIKEKVDENKIIYSKIKSIDIEDFENKNENNINIFKEKITEYRNYIKNNKEYEKELDNCYLNKDLFFKNHAYLEKILEEIKIKNNNINSMKEQLYKLKEKYNKLNENKKKIITFNDSIQKNNEKLLKEKKKREDFLMKKPIISKQIDDFKKRSNDLKLEEESHEIEIKRINKIKEEKNKKKKEKKEKIKIDIEINPDNKIDKRIKLYESLIKESKERQKEFIELFEYYNNFIKKEENKNDSNKLDFKDENKIEEKDNDYSAFINSPLNSTNRKNDIVINKKIDEQEEDFNNFKFLLSIMFYIKKISRDKIENILLNYRTQNYYIEKIKDKNNFLLQLSKDILSLIKDKNENDIKLLKNLFIYLYNEKYKNNKELFFDNVINDFVEKNKILFKKNEENELFEKVKKEYLNNSKSIKEKINKKNRE